MYSVYMMFRKQNNTTIFALALILGVALATGVSVWATSIGSSISVSGNVTADGSVTASSASASSSITYALGIGTSTPAMMFSVGGAAGNTAGHAYFTGGVGIGRATTTAGGLETTGAGLIGGAFNVTGAATLNSTLTVSGLATLSGGAVVNAASSTNVNLTMVNSTTTNATTTKLYLGTGGLFADSASSTIRNLSMNAATSSAATTTSFYVDTSARFGTNGTSVSSIIHGFCSFGPQVVSQSVAATSTGAVQCTSEAPTGLAAGDKVWLTASSTAMNLNGAGSITYTGLASSTASNVIRALVYNGTGAAWTVTTSTWQYLIVK